MPKINSRAKGCNGEREVRDLIQSFGFSARRGQQFSGSPESPGVIHSIPGVHVEVKRAENFSLYPALDQSRRDCPVGHMPTVWHRKSRRDWVVVLPAEDFLRLVGGGKTNAETLEMLK